MADIRINQLPLATGGTAPSPSDVVALDGTTTRKAPLSALADVIRPMANQAEAEAGVNSVKAMSPLTTAQAIAAQAATVSQGALASTALQPSDIGTSVASQTQVDNVADSIKGTINGAESVKTNDYTVVTSDNRATIVANKATPIEIALGAVSGFDVPFQVRVFNANIGPATINPAGAETINGADTLVLAQNETATIWLDASEAFWRADVGGGNDGAGFIDRPMKWQMAVADDFQPDRNPSAPSDDGGIYPNQVQIATDIFAEMKVYHPNIAHLVIGGDLLDRFPPSVAEQSLPNPHFTPEEFVEIMYASGVAHISTIPGNHDRDYRQFTDRTLPAEGDPFYNYRAFFQRPFYYEVWGNTVQIYMGDMGGGVINSDGGSHGIIPDWVFEWYKKVREGHEGYNIIVHTHQWLFGTGMGTSSDPLSDQYIRGWDRFTTHLMSYPVSVWTSGHTMGYTATNPAHMHSFAYNGCLFINAGLHIPGHSTGDVTDLTYILLDFEDGSDQLQIRRWNHITKDYVAAGAVTVTLPYKARLAHVPSHDGRFQKSEFDPYERKLTLNRSIELNPADGSVALGPYWMTDAIVDDRLGANIPANLQVGHLLQIPGGLDSDTTNLVHNYGAGAAWTAQRIAAADDDYRTDFVGYASGAGKTEASLIEVFRARWDGAFLVAGNLLAQNGAIYVSKSATDITVDGIELRAGGVATFTATSQAAIFVNQKGTDGAMVVFRNDNVTNGTIANTGTGVAYNVTSDAKLKIDKGELTFEEAREILDLITFHNFIWNENSGAPGVEDEGVFAQELHKVYPKAVTPGCWLDPETLAEVPEGTEGAIYQPWSVDYSKLVTVLGRCVQGVMEGQDSLDLRLSKLENS